MKSALHTFGLTLRTLFAMAKKRWLEPLLIIAAIAVANAGLITVLLINEGAEQGELLEGKDKLFTDNVLVPIDSDLSLTKEDYVKARLAGFTQLAALAQRTVRVSCGDASSRTFSVNVMGVDTQVLMSHFASVSNLQNGGVWLSTEMQGQNNTAVRGLMHPATLGEIACKNLVSSDVKWPSPINPVVSAAVPQDTLVIAIADFYRHDVTVQDTPLSGLLSLMPLSSQDIEALNSITSVTLVKPQNTLAQETGSLPDSFKLNLWAMSALMGVVALFIVLNALNLMYRTRLPNMIRLRQLGIQSYVLSLALVAELLIYCVFGIPLGMIAGFHAASWLSPVISGTFSSLFSAVFITPDVNLLSIFLFALTVTFTSLVVFSLLPVTQLANALSHRKIKQESQASLAQASVISCIVLLVLYLLSHFVSSTTLALGYVAALLLSSCALVLLWLPILTKWLATVTPKRWVVLFFVVSNMQSLSSKSRLAVCAFFIALTANIGMNTMTSSFRDATVDWLKQRLYAPAYLYTDMLYSDIVLPDSLDATPLMRLKATLNEQTISVSSYPLHTEGQIALLLDNAVDDAWKQFSKGQGVFINQQLALMNNVRIGDTLSLSNYSLATNRSGLDKNITTLTVDSDTLDKALFSEKQAWRVLGIYPDYGNTQGQVFVPLPRLLSARKENNELNDMLFSGAMALYPAPKNSASPSTLIDSTLTDSAITALAAPFGNAYSKTHLLNQSLKVFDRTFLLTDGLNITTLVVAGIAFAVSLTVLSLGNAPQLNTLRALGVSRLQVKSALFTQYFLLCLVTAILAIPFGIFLAYVFIVMVNRYAFNWVYPIVIQTEVIMSSVMLSLAIVSLVLLLPLGKLEPKVDLRQEVQL